MAHCRGRSGPLSDVLRVVRRLGLDPRGGDATVIRQIDAHADRLAADQRAATKRAVQDVASEIDRLRESIACWEKGEAAECAAAAGAARPPRLETALAGTIRALLPSRPALGTGGTDAYS